MMQACGLVTVQNTSTNFHKCELQLQLCVMTMLDKKSCAVGFVGAVNLICTESSVQD